MAEPMTDGRLALCSGLVTAIAAIVAAICVAWDSYLLGSCGHGNTTIAAVGFVAVAVFLLADSVSLSRGGKDDG